MPSLWYASYDDTSKDAESAGFYPDPGTVASDLPAGKSLSVGFEGDIPDDFVDVETRAPNYTYNTSTEQLEPKA